jgi:hypothetical protein
MGMLPLGTIWNVVSLGDPGHCFWQPGIPNGHDKINRRERSTIANETLGSVSALVQPYRWRSITVLMILGSPTTDHIA